MDVERGHRTARLCQRRDRVSVRWTCRRPAGPEFRDSGAAGHHLLRLARVDPLLSRHHAADRALDRRRHRMGDRCVARRKPVRSGEYLRRAERKPARHPALSRQPHACAAVHRHDERHGGRRGDDPCGLCLDGHPHRLSACGELHGRAGWYSHGQDHDARYARHRRAGRRRRYRRGEPRRGAAREPHHGGGTRRADRRAARGRGRRDGACVRGARGARERHIGRHRWLVWVAEFELSDAARLCLCADHVPAECAVE